MYRVTCKFLEEFLCSNADLVEITTVAELNANGHHMYVEALHVIIGNVSGRVGYDGELVSDFMRAVLLSLHVVCFLAT